MTELALQVAKKLNITIAEESVPPQGMSSEVLLLKDTDGKDYAVKYSQEANVDESVLTLIATSSIAVPVPKMLASFHWRGKTALVMQKIHFPLLESVSVDQMARYIPSMINTLRGLHQLKARRVSQFGSEQVLTSWQEFMLSIFNGKTIDWAEVATRPLLDTQLILASVERIATKITSTHFSDQNYCLLHTDFNQRNLFIDPNSDQISGVIDWSEAMYGDPIYDFARVRMLIWHFNMSTEVINDYYKLMNYTVEQKRLEELYWLSRVIEYLAYYSQELNEFNLGRIKLHQEFLRHYNWAN
jgi:aminoglycoside phosphotransferase (APT) family kinase protein